MHVTGEPDGPPTSVGLPICDLGTGMWAVQGILAALYERERSPASGQSCGVLAARDGHRLQLLDQRRLARRPQGADPARLAPSPERTLPAHVDQGRLHHDRCVRPVDLEAVRRGAGPSRVGRRSAVCGAPGADVEPRYARSDDGGGARDQHDGTLGRGARCGRRSVRSGQHLRAACSTIRRSSTGKWSSTPTTRNWATCRTSARRSRWATTSPCAASHRSLASTMVRFTPASA